MPRITDLSSFADDDTELDVDIHLQHDDVEALRTLQQLMREARAAHSGNITQPSLFFCFSKFCTREQLPTLRPFLTIDRPAYCNFLGHYRLNDFGEFILALHFGQVRLTIESDL